MGASESIRYCACSFLSGHTLGACPYPAHIKPQVKWQCNLCIPDADFALHVPEAIIFFIQIAMTALRFHPGLIVAVFEKMHERVTFTRAETDVSIGLHRHGTNK